MSMFNSKLRINFPMVFRVIGWLLIIEALFMIIPLATCIIYGESDYMAFAIAIAVTFFGGMVMNFGIKPTHKSMGKREGFLLTALVWIIFSFFGMIPFMLSCTPLNFTDAFFETMSGFTTTGATVYTDIDNLSHGINIWRCLTQWLGGMGIILFTLAVLPMLNHSGGMQMFNAEVTGITHDKLRPRISQTAKTLWSIYFLLTAAVGVLLMIGPMDIFDSVCHALSIMSTGGFSTRTDSLAAWSSDYIMIVITVFMFLGGVNFALIYQLSRGNWRPVWKNDTFRAYVKIIFWTYVAFVISRIVRGNVDSINSVTLDPLFQIITTISSTGLTVSEYDTWGSFVMSVLFILMFFGACAGSTSGGAKIDRLLFLIKNTDNELYRSIRPNAIRSVRINGNIVTPEIVSKVIAFLCLYVILICVGAVALTLFGMPMVDALFNSFSCMSNIGLVSDTANIGGLTGMMGICKWILATLMLVGRLEIFTVLILFTPAFWAK